MVPELGAARCLRKLSIPAALMAAVNECLAEARSRVSGLAQSSWPVASATAVLQTIINAKRVSAFPDAIGVGSRN